ncbi:MAG TPA: hypothetical protein VGV09_01295 [Steroidobacteraceae bacterium]|nr:hypothetical protein [Steroidobacteraceae bacterium]
MVDDFIRSLKADWDPKGIEATVVRLRRRRWIPLALLALDLMSAATMALFGLIYAGLALRYRDLLFALSAIAMLPVGLPLVAGGIRVRWRALVWEGTTSEDVLQSSLRRLVATAKVLQLARSGTVVLFVLAMVVWAAALTGLLREPRAILFVITATWVLAGLGGLGWIQWRLARVGREIAGCDALLRQFELSADDASS